MRIIYITLLRTFLFSLLFTAPVLSADEVTILLTSNLQGRFIPDIKDQEARDPMLLLARSILWEKKKGARLFIDLGNAFYPGLLSKHNFGAAMMDFFTFFNCKFSLVSSEDLRLGMETLEFLQKGSKTRLLSANILREKENVFRPYHIETVNSRKIAFIGLSSKKILFDVAEKNVYNIAINDEKEVLERIIPQVREQGATDIVLVSGLNHRENMKLLKIFKEISMVITGGDNRGEVISGTVARMDTADGRSIVSVPADAGYCLLSISLDKALKISQVQFKKARKHDIDSEEYRDFIKRITGWKEEFIKDVDRILAEMGEGTINLDQERIAYLLQDKYRGEVAIVPADSVIPMTLEQDVKLLDILSAINDNYSIYTYRLSGLEIKKIGDYLSAQTVTGLKDGKIQGYAVNDKRKYKIVSTQTAFENIERRLRRKIKYRNTWKNISELIIEDLKGKMVILKKDFRYLDHRFRPIFDLYLSMFYERSDLVIDKDISIPTGEPDEEYSKWGIEAQVDITIYNRYNKFIFTPYIYYIQQEDLMLKNLFRGTVFYSLNFNPYVNPYHKAQVETVLKKVRGNSIKPNNLSTPEKMMQYREYLRKYRPVEARETLGMVITSKYLNGKVGAGFEKQIFDPAKPIVYGFEVIINFKIDFLTYLAYSIDLDSFISIPKIKGDGEVKSYLKNQLENKLSFKITEMLNLSVKHRWYYYYLLKEKKRYSNSQFITAFDIKTDFKI